MNIITVGRGEMAITMQKQCERAMIPHIMVSRKFKDYLPAEINFSESVVVNFGSENSLPDTISLCLEKEIPLIHGSSTKEAWPENLLVLEAVNLSIPTIRFFNSVSAFKGETTNHRIVESHQSKKKGVSATAIRLASIIGGSPDSISSIRDENVQKLVGIPDDYLSGHAYHSVSFSFNEVEVVFQIKVLGREPYADGALFFAKLLLDKRESLERRVYTPEELLCLT